MSNFKKAAVVLTSGQRRAQKRAGNPAAFTRAEAQAKIAGTVRNADIEPFLNHQNSHVKSYAAHKLEMLKAKRSAAAKKAAQTRKQKQQVA